MYGLDTLNQHIANGYVKISSENLAPSKIDLSRISKVLNIDPEGELFVQLRVGKDFPPHYYAKYTPTKQSLPISARFIMRAYNCGIMDAYNLIFTANNTEAQLVNLMKIMGTLTKTPVVTFSVNKGDFQSVKDSTVKETKITSRHRYDMDTQITTSIEKLANSMFSVHTDKYIEKLFYKGVK